MNEIVNSLRKLLKNKNLVTIVGVIIILVLLYVGYSSQINRQVEPVEVVVAKETIQPRTEITEDMVDTIKVPAVALSENVYASKTAVVGKYTNINSVVPAGSMFYKETVISKDELPDSVFVKVKAGEIVYSFPVDMESTYGNSIYPGNKIDIYMKTGDGQEEKVLLGKLIGNVEVLAVKDSSGKNVFEDTSEDRVPAMLIFGVPAKINLLLRQASYMESLGVELFPVPHGGSVKTDGATEVSTQQLADYIEAHSINVPVDEKKDTLNDELLPVVSSENVALNGTVTIKYPKGCGTKFICKYIKDNEPEVTVTKRKASVKFIASGSIKASVVENDGTSHDTTETITIGQTADQSTAG